MTIPQFSDQPTENLGGGEKRDPSEYVPWDRIAEVVTPRGNRPGCVMIVRPLERIKDFRAKDPEEDWKTLVVADIAILDVIPSTPDQFGIMLPPISGGSQWRNQVVFPGMLNKAWRDKIGNTLIGMIYYGQAKPTAQGTMGKPPFLWRSLATDEQQVRRGQSFMAARPEFLVPIPRVAPQQAGRAPQDTYVTTQQDPWASAAPQQGHAQPMTQNTQWAAQQPEPWSQPLGQQPQYTQPVQYVPPQQDVYYQQHSVHPVQQAPQPQYQQQPAQMAAAPQAQPPQGNPYGQPDPWAQQPAQAVSPGQPQVQQHPNQGLSTLEQLKQEAARTNHQGQPQDKEPPF